MTEEIVILSLEETSKLLRTSKSKLRKLLANGELKGFKIGKNTWRIPQESVRNYITECMDSYK